MTDFSRPVRLPVSVLVPIGPAASGKSTLASKLMAAGLEPAGVISTDAKRMELCTARPCRCKNAQPDCPGGVDCQCCNPAVYAACDAMAESRARTGRSVFRDSTNLDARSRRHIVERAHSVGIPAVALLAKHRSTDELLARDASRERTVPADVIAEMNAKHAAISEQTLYAEGFDVVVTFDDSTRFELMPTGPDATGLSGPFIVFPDLHKCAATLDAALAQFGFDEDLNHPDGALAVFLGDATEKGGPPPGSYDPVDDKGVQLLRRMMRWLHTGRCLEVRSNHIRKVGKRIAAGERTDEDPEVAATLQAIWAQPDADTLVRDLLRTWSRLPTHLIFDDDGHQFIVAHAGMKPDHVGEHGRRVESSCLYRRDGWWQTWDRPEDVIYGHVTVPEVRRHRLPGAGETVGLDLGACDGGGLACWRSDTSEVIVVPTEPEDARRYVHRDTAYANAS